MKCCVVSCKSYTNTSKLNGIKISFHSKQLLILCCLLMLTSALYFKAMDDVLNFSYKCEPCLCAINKLDKVLNPASSLTTITNTTTNMTTTANPVLQCFKKCGLLGEEEASCVKNLVCAETTVYLQAMCPFFENCCPEDQIDLDATPRPVGCGHSNPGDIALRLLTSDSGNAYFGEFPWMIALMKKNVTGDKFHDAYLGGGTLIHPSVVLTVAHKVDEISASNLKCRAGEWETNYQDEVYSHNEFYSHQDRDAKKIIIHEEYDRVKLYNDFALIILEKPFDLSKGPHIGVACLERQLPQAGTECYSMGWGEDFRTSERKNATRLKKIKLPIVEKNKCQNAYRNSRFGMFYNTHYSFVCAGGLPNSHICVGDGGSPLVCPIADKKYVRYSVVGLVSYGLECGSSVPIVHANIPEAYNWILTQYALEGFSNPEFTT